MGASSKLMIILAGNAGHGKSTLEEMLKEIIGRWTSVRSDAYAYTLKKVVHDTLGVPWHVLNAPKDVKESTFVSSWGGEEITVRQALQDVGEWFRQRFGHLIWANSVKHRAEFAQERVTIVSDARHPKEEIHWMRESCSKFSRVIVVRIRRSSVPINRGHPSEDFIADESDDSFDLLLENEGSLEQLRVAASEVACACAYLAKVGKKKVKRGGDGWLVMNDSGVLVCEPLISESEARVAAKHYDVATASCQPSESHTVCQATYHNLGGNAVGR